MTSPKLRAALGACALIAAAAAATSACGRVGALEPPGPVATARPAPPAVSAPPAVVRQGADPLPAGLTTSGAVRSSDGTSTDRDENAPVTKRDIQDPNQRLAPLSVQPVDGAPNPLGSPVSTRPPG